MSTKSDERYDLWDEMHKIKQDPVLIHQILLNTLFNILF